MKDKDIKRFWSKVDVRGESDCWEWTAAKNGGYGVFSLKGKTEVAHRISAELAGLEAEGLCVCHHCDNPACVNPAHLFVGSHLDNMRDKMQKGRQKPGRNHGEANARHKLSEDQVLEIRELGKSGWSRIALAERFVVSSWTISQIINRKIWKHI